MKTPAVTSQPGAAAELAEEAGVQQKGEKDPREGDQCQCPTGPALAKTTAQ